MPDNSPSYYSKVQGNNLPDYRYSFSVCNVYWVPRQGTKVNVSSFIQSVFSDSPLTNSMGGQWLRSSDRYREESSDVIGCSWNKDTSSPAGTFSMSLKPTKMNDYLTKLQNGDLLVIYMDNKFTKGSNGKLITIGTIDLVSEDRQVSGNGTTLLTIQVSGRDLGKVLQETALVFDPALAAEAQGYFTQALLTGKLARRSAFSPVETVMTVLNLFFSNVTNSRVIGEQWRLPGDPTKSLLCSLLEVGSFVQTPMFGWMAANVPALSQGSNVWSLIDSMANKLVNEMFIDIRDTGPGYDDHITYADNISANYVGAADTEAQNSAVNAAKGNFAPLQLNATSLSFIFRQLPYDVTSFSHLPTSNVDERECYTSKTGKSAHEVFNYFRLQGAGIPALYQELSYGILINEESIRNFGIHRLDAQSRYCFPNLNSARDHNQGKQPGVDWDAALAYYLGLLKTWNVANEDLYSGSIVCRFRPDIRVGTRVRHRFTGADNTLRHIDYYVQAVSHQFGVQQGSSRTVLTVIRGINAADKQSSKIFSATWDASGSGVESTFVKFTASGAVLPNVQQDNVKDQSAGFKDSVKKALQDPGNVDE